MRYFVVDCITGVKHGKGYAKLEDAEKKRDRLNANEVANGHPDGFWIIVDSDGKKVI